MGKAGGREQRVATGWRTTPPGVRCLKQRVGVERMNTERSSAAGQLSQIMSAPAGRKALQPGVSASPVPDELKTGRHIGSYASEMAGAAPIVLVV